MEVCFYATLEPLVGQRRVELSLPPDATIRDLVEKLAEGWPALREHLFEENGALSRRVNIFLGGRNVRWLRGLDTPVGEGESVDIFPPVAGG